MGTMRLKSHLVTPLIVAGPWQAPAPPGLDSSSYTGRRRNGTYSAITRIIVLARDRLSFSFNVQYNLQSKVRLNLQVRKLRLREARPLGKSGCRCPGLCEATASKLSGEKPGGFRGRAPSD